MENGDICTMTLAFGALGSAPFPPEIQEHLAGLDGQVRQDGERQATMSDTILDVVGVTVSLP
jgi:branched-chain amino acid transport system ATP-binding protein